MKEEKPCDRMVYRKEAVMKEIQLTRIIYWYLLKFNTDS